MGDRMLRGHLAPLPPPERKELPPGDPSRWPPPHHPGAAQGLPLLEISEIPKLEAPELFSGLLHPIYPPNTAGRPSKYCVSHIDIFQTKTDAERGIKFIKFM